MSAKRLLVGFFVGACATSKPVSEAPPRVATSASAPTSIAAALSNPIKKEEPAPATTPAPAATTAWGNFGRDVKSGKELKLHSRIRWKDAPEEAEITLDLCIAKTACPEVLVRYEVENAESAPVSLWHSGFWLNHRVWVTNPGGTEAKLTRYGEDMARAFTPRGARDKNVEWPIKPKKIDESEGPISLFALYGISPEPGHYFVRVDYEEDIAFASNTLSLWIIPFEAREIMKKLNSWDKEECDVAERPEADAGRVSSGETNGFISSHKEQLEKLGVTVKWESVEREYKITAAKRP